MRDLRICYVGDSFVAGAGDRSGLGWVGRVGRAAMVDEERLGFVYTGYNLGVRRDTAPMVAARFVAEVTARLVPAQDRRVVLSFGANDTTIENGSRRAETEETVAALHRIHRDIHGDIHEDIHRGAHRDLEGTRLFVVGPPAVDDDAHNERIGALSVVLEREAALLSVPFVPAFPVTEQDPVWRRQVREGDGAHPDAGGYEVLAELVRDPILQWMSGG
ncbi:GDSL-type esterase/lipase family protein [Kineosporia sp. NBRC 101731]|uniref:GDSL-type esterase/lipase family protein n=1 Tax=Kineosporia sp. NBRC 101731 TaxID=3032199 RepID=UPI0024A5F72A|nr:GDSL-type esterase/lipase family protein [Kineosporia sp. NBRC 101731]GLY28747.1 lysophospholipase [Kineosporia sp. NBRC 101731]